MIIREKQALFVNEFYITKELLYDASTFSFCKKYLITAFIGATMIGLGFWLLFTSFVIALSTAVITGFFPFFARQIVKKLCLRHALKKIELSSHLTQQISQRTFYDGHFFTNNNGDDTLFYSQISSIANTALCLCLTLDPTTTILIKKDAFTTGTYDDFVVFLRDKLHDNPKALKGLR